MFKDRKKEIGHPKENSKEIVKAPKSRKWSKNIDYISPVYKIIKITCGFSASWIDYMLHSLPHLLILTNLVFVLEFNFLIGI
ncbi:hypothetical protein [Porphyromonas pogonae]|uniref:hypothetical protein n=1 Tax=Porphyromonas pogonae TaxID=867595 RepID=UPI002E791DD9|nr:hypothetical protein [Porphyromonas pogonae]